MQYMMQQHQLHLTTIQTLTILLEKIQADPELKDLKLLTAKALMDHIKPLTKSPIEQNEIIG